MKQRVAGISHLQIFPQQSFCQFTNLIEGHWKVIHFWHLAVGKTGVTIEKSNHIAFKEVFSLLLSNGTVLQDRFIGKLNELNCFLLVDYQKGQDVYQGTERSEEKSVETVQRALWIDRPLKETGFYFGILK